MSHTLLRGGTVYDGASPSGRRVDVRIHGGVIAEIGSDLDSADARVIDVADAWVMPGFVDSHSHADAAVLTGHEMARRAISGVTTEIVGQDGLGLPYTATGEGDVVTDVLTAIAGPLPGTFADVAAYLRDVDAGAFARTAVLAPHGTVRAAVSGRSLDSASETARAQMRELIRCCLEQGACGVSTGLSYAPALAAGTDEVVDVLSGLPAGAPYVTHVRSYGAGLREAITEAGEIAARAHLSLHLSHLHLSGPGEAGRAAQLVDDVVALSPDVTWDSYPYLSGCTFLTAVLPGWAQELPAAALVADPDRRARAVADIDRLGPGATVAAGWDGIVLTGLKDGHLSHWERRDIAATAAREQLSPGEVVLRAVEATAGQSCILVRQGHLENVVAISVNSRHMVGSDGIFGSGAPHPRLTMSFLRFLAYALDGTVPFSVGEAVARMTSRPAKRFGLPVGTLTIGVSADVVVVDPTRLSPGPELEDATATAVTDVFIAGEATVRDGVWIGNQLKEMALRRRWT